MKRRASPSRMKRRQNRKRINRWSQKNATSIHPSIDASGKMEDEKGAVIVYILGASGVLADALCLAAPAAPRAEERAALAAAAAAPAPAIEVTPIAASR